MFEKYMICENGFRNIYEGNEIVGFELKIKIPYYRGVPLSIIEDIKVTVDGEKFEKDNIVFSVASGSFTFKEMETVVNNRWEFGEEATLTVKRPGGLALSEHVVELEQVLRISYLPWLSVNKHTKTLKLA